MKATPVNKRLGMGKSAGRFLPSHNVLNSQNYPASLSEKPIVSHPYDEHKEDSFLAEPDHIKSS
jgi:hypothetical protein